MLPELSQVVAVVRSVAATLPSGCATFALHGDPEHEVILSLTPIDERAAGVVVHAQAGEGMIDVGLGHGGFFEVPSEGRRYSDLGQLDEVRALCLAAVHGRYRETVWMLDGETVRSRGFVTIGSVEVPLYWAQLRNPLRRTERREIFYAPYDTDAAAA